MIFGSIAEGAINITLTGLKEAQKQLDQLHKKADGKKNVKLDPKDAGKGKDFAKAPKAENGAAMAGATKALAGIAVAVAALGLAYKALSMAGEGVVTTLQTIGALAKSADPVRYEMMEAKFEVLNVIVGKSFIPLLQLAEKTLDRVAAILRTGLNGGGFQNFIKSITVVLERIVNVLLPYFEKGVKILDDTFGSLTDEIDGFGGVLEDMFNVNGEHLLNELKLIASVMKDLISTGIKLATIYWDTFGDLTTSWVEGMAIVLKAMAEYISDVCNQAVKLAELFKSSLRHAITEVVKDLNSLIGMLNSVIDTLVKMGEVYNKVVKRIGGPTIDIEALKALKRNPFKEPTFNDRDKNKIDPNAKKGLTNNSLHKTATTYGGIEDTYKRIQSGAAQDPKLKVLEEQLRQQKETAENTEKIANNTGKPIAAENL